MESQALKTINTATILEDGEILVGKVTKPFIQEGKLMGAILGFEGRSETALLHRKQMVGDDKSGRLANLKLGDALTVKLLVSGERPNRKTWASEVGIEDGTIVERLVAEMPKRVAGKVINSTDYGVFIELQSGIAAGRRGLVHAKNMCKGGTPSLSAFTSFVSGASLDVDVLGASIDSKGTMRIDLAPSSAR